ncbi:MAG: hypothetical protein WA160_04380 [Pseudobdellovibrio sp.]
MKYYIYLILCVLITSCNYSKQKDSASLSNSTSSFSNTTIIDFALIKTYSLSSCLACHSGSQAPDISTAAGAKNFIARILARVDVDTMPPSNGGYRMLDACQKALLHKWSDLGSPVTSTTTIASVPECKNSAGGIPTPAPVIPISQMPLNYNTLLTKILQPKCIMCHSSTGTMADLQFYPYKTLMLKSSKWTAPGKTSSIYKEVIQKTMPPANSGISFLTIEESDFLAKWIDSGKPEL